VVNAALLPEVLTTQRLVARAPVPADARLLFEHTRDPEVSRYMTWRPHAALEETEAFIAACLEEWHAGRSQTYVLAFRATTGTPIGVLEARPGPHGVEVGYWLSRVQWGRGLMPEALAAVAEAAFALPGVFRLQAPCDIDNRASARVLEKSGFVREARLERYSVHPNLSEEPRACFLYARCR
jgi:RimJ/RimL family protein N-acetyltransferase